METTEKNSAEKFKVTGDWAVQSKSLKAKYSQLTDADLKLEAGKDEELVKRISARLNKKREEVLNILKKAQPEKVSS